MEITGTWEARTVPRERGIRRQSEKERERT
jgi:hypothetical protein